MQEKWDIQTWDYSRNKWRNHGHIVKLPPKKKYIKSALEFHIRWHKAGSYNEPYGYFHKQEDILYDRSTNKRNEICRNDMSLGEAVKKYRDIQSNDLDPFNRSTIWDIFANKYRFYDLAEDINLTDFCDDSDGVFRHLAESVLDPTDFDKIEVKSSTKYFTGIQYPPDYFSSPDTLYDELISFKGVVFRKSSGKVFMNSCAIGHACNPNY